MIWHNGAISDENVDFSRYDSGCFTTGRIVNGRIWLQTEHEQRLRTTCAELGITFPAFDLAQAVRSLVEKNAWSTARFRSTIAITEGQVDVFCSIASLPFSRDSITLKSVFLSNEFTQRSIKTIDRVDYQYYAKIAANEKCDDVLLYDARDNVLETAIANVFLIFGNDIVTPPSDMSLLPGLVRNALLSARFDAYRVREKKITCSDMASADGVFVTNAVRGIEPVASIDAHRFSTNAVAAFKRIADDELGFTQL